MLIPLGPTMTLAALLQTVLALLPAPPADIGAGLAAGLGAGAGAAASSDLSTSGSLQHGAAATTVPTWVPPLRGPLEVLDGFRPPEQAWLAGHRGVDLAATLGDEVHAAASGVVLWAGDLAGRGVVSVLHGDGRRTTYEPVAPVVHLGDLVSEGAVIGRLAGGTSHCGGLPSCLHWGLRAGEEYLDPMTVLPATGHPRLLPLSP